MQLNELFIILIVLLLVVLIINNINKCEETESFQSSPQVYSAKGWFNTDFVALKKYTCAKKFMSNIKGNCLNWWNNRNTNKVNLFQTVTDADGNYRCELWDCPSSVTSNDNFIPSGNDDDGRALSYHTFKTAKMEKEERDAATKKLLQELDAEERRKQQEKERKCQEEIDNEHKKNISKTPITKINWIIDLFDYKGSLIFMYGKNYALNINIKDNSTDINTFDNCLNTWGNDITTGQFLNTARPLKFVVSFDTTKGFTINYNGNDIATIKNIFKIKNAEGIKVYTDNDIEIKSKTDQELTTEDKNQSPPSIISLVKTNKISKSKTKINPYFKVENANYIRDGLYNNIPFKTFGLNENLNEWTISIKFTAKNDSSKFQGIIGNLYNKFLQKFNDGWGFFLSPTGYIYFRNQKMAYLLSNLGKINNDTPYILIINYTNRTYKIILNDLINNIAKEINITNQPKLISNIGNICLGGKWEKKFNDEQFEGDITFVGFCSNNLSKTPEQENLQALYERERIDLMKNEIGNKLAVALRRKDLQNKIETSRDNLDANTCNMYVPNCSDPTHNISSKCQNTCARYALNPWHFESNS